MTFAIEQSRPRRLPGVGIFVIGCHRHRAQERRQEGRQRPASAKSKTQDQDARARRQQRQRRRRYQPIRLIYRNETLQAWNKVCFKAAPCETMANRDGYRDASSDAWALTSIASLWQARASSPTTDTVPAAPTTVICMPPPLHVHVQHVHVVHVVHAYMCTCM